MGEKKQKRENDLGFGGTGRDEMGWGDLERLFIRFLDAPFFFLSRSSGGECRVCDGVLSIVDACM